MTPTPSALSPSASPAPAPTEYVDANAAMQMLGIRRQTLYAYVSRNLIASIGQPNRKDRLYLRADVERMAIRSLARTGHGALAASAMNWGDPIVSSAITEITPEGPRYRGYLATDLARMRVPFESVAELLWTGFLNDSPVRWTSGKPSSALLRVTESMASRQAIDQLLEIFGLVTLQLGVGNGTEASAAERGQGGRIYDAARQIVLTLVGCCGFAGPEKRFVPIRSGEPLVQGLTRIIGVEATVENCESLEAILVLFADHELSPGTLCARVCASGGSALHACIASGLCAIAGLDIGRQYLRVDAFLEGAGTKAALLQRAAEAQARGLVVPGFVHPVYPEGDPRARYLLNLLRRRSSLARSSKMLLDFVDEMESTFGLHPRHELAMVALARAVGAPKQVPGALHGLARTVGWVAHVQEQRLMGTLMRPRAKFVGTPRA